MPIFVQKILRPLILGVCVLLGSLAMVDGWAQRLIPTQSPQGEVILRALFGTFAAGVAVAYIAVSLAAKKLAWWPDAGARLKATDDGDTWKMSQLDEDWVRSTVAGIPSEIASRVKNYGGMLTHFAGRASHSHEEYVIHETSMERTTRNSYLFPTELRAALLATADQDGRGTVPFPLYVVPKGQLPRDFRASIGSTQLPVTPYADVLELQLRTLLTIYRRVFPHRRRQLLNKISRHVASNVAREDMSAAAAQNAGLLAELQRAHWASAREIRRQHEDSAYELLHWFVKTYGTSYPICVEIPIGEIKEVTTLTWSETVLHRGSVGNIGERVRRWFGLAPYKYRFPLLRHAQSESYHLTIRAPQHMHLYSQYFERKVKGVWQRMLVRDVPRHIPETGFEQIRHTRWSDENVSHLYMRGFLGVEHDRMSITARFHERPPGMLGAVTLLLGTLLVSMSALGWFASHGRFPASLNVLSLLLALPGIAAGQLDQKQVGLKYTSLHTRLGLLATMAISGLALVLYAGEQARLLSPPQLEIVMLSWELPISDVSWLALIGITSLLWMNLGARLFRATLDYVRRARASAGDRLNYDTIDPLRPTPGGVV